ncbi:hypothetical protein ACM61V_22490 [Sphingomonas sp. TX0543]|uniref:hypothetical protein n=1 Tax=Sphingomonas sp. TX0543 TaxID=3399682 RepID=UPI003AFABEBD
MLDMDDAEIVKVYNAELRGFANYYALAVDVKRALSKLDGTSGEVVCSRPSETSTGSALSLLFGASGWLRVDMQRALALERMRGGCRSGAWLKSKGNPSSGRRSTTYRDTEALRFARTNLADRGACGRLLNMRKHGGTVFILTSDPSTNEPRSRASAACS